MSKDHSLTTEGKSFAESLTEDSKSFVWTTTLFGKSIQEFDIICKSSKSSEMTMEMIEYGVPDIRHQSHYVPVRIRFTVPSKRAGRKGTRKDWKRRNPPRLVYLDLSSVELSGGSDSAWTTFNMSDPVTTTIRYDKGIYEETESVNQGTPVMTTNLPEVSTTPICSVGDQILAPWLPTEEMWGGLARQIMMWLDFDGRPTPESLLKHLERCAEEIPQWLRDESEMQNPDHVLSKGTRCVLLYRAMVDPIRKRALEHTYGPGTLLGQLEALEKLLLSRKSYMEAAPVTQAISLLSTLTTPTDQDATSPPVTDGVAAIMESLKELTDGWNGPGSCAVNPAVLQDVSKFFYSKAEPKIEVADDGGVVLLWENNNHSFALTFLGNAEVVGTLSPHTPGIGPWTIPLDDSKVD